MLSTERQAGENCYENQGRVPAVCHFISAIQHTPRYKTTCRYRRSRRLYNKIHMFCLHFLQRQPIWLLKSLSPPFKAGTTSKTTAIRQWRKARRRVVHAERHTNCHKISVVPKNNRSQPCAQLRMLVRRGIVVPTHPRTGHLEPGTNAGDAYR